MPLKRRKTTTESNSNIGILFQLDDGAYFDRTVASVFSPVGVNLKQMKVVATNDVSSELARMVVANPVSWQVSINKSQTRLVELDAGYLNNLEGQL